MKTLTATCDWCGRSGLEAWAVAAEWRDTGIAAYTDSWNRSAELCFDCEKVFSKAWRDAEDSVGVVEDSAGLTER